MELFRKYAWQVNLIGTIFFLSRFVMAGYHWWHLLGTLIFFTSFLQSILKKNKKNFTTKKMHSLDLKIRDDLLDRMKKDFELGLSQDQTVISDLEFEYLEDIVNNSKHHFKDKLNDQVLDVYEYNKRKKRDQAINAAQEEIEKKRISEAKAFTLERKEQEILQQRRKRNREKLNDLQNKETLKYKKKKISRHIKQDVKDKVWRRDQGKCVKCGTNHKIEFDHILPFSKGGKSTYRNLQLLCQSCNLSKGVKAE